MVKNNENNQAETPKTSTSPSLKKMIVWVVFLGVIYALLRNPKIVTDVVDYVSDQVETVAETNGEQEAKENSMLRQIALLQQQVNSLQSRVVALSGEVNAPVDLTRYDEKIEAIEKKNLNVIDSKADVATVLGIINRLDKVEAKLDDVAKISDDGALVLTAAMMVKESADNGISFVYEAEILNQLAKNEAALKSDVETVLLYAREGIKSQNALIQEFQAICERLAKVQTRQDLEGKSWKEILNIKFSEVVKVKRVNDLAEPKELAQAEDDLMRVNKAVKNAEFSVALDELHQSENPIFENDAALQKWMSEAQARVNFNQAIAHISAHSLAIMKVNNIRNGNK